MTSCEVLIVGAGPAGALLGYLLASRGVETLILEKRSLPRYKLCAGGLTERAVELIPFNIDHLVEDDARTLQIGYHHRPLYSETSTRPLIRMVMRDRLDAFLCKKASEAGAEVRDGESFRGLSGSGEFKIKTDKEELRFRILVGADGVNSRTARALGLRVRTRRMAAVQGEVYPPSDHLMERFRGRADLDFGVIPKGYGWVFPKSDHLTAGIGTTADKLHDLMGWCRRYLAGKGLANGCRIAHFRGHLIPYSPRRGSLFANRRGLLVGDAAGVTDPITGEGLYHAFQGARLAADVIVDALKAGDRNRLLRYNRDFQRVILDELAVIHRVAPLFYQWPGLIRWCFTTYGSRAGRAYLDIAAGRKTYNAVFKGWFRSLTQNVYPIEK